MPELPEVETIKLGLSPVIIGKSFTQIWQRRKNIRIDFPPNFSSILENTTIIDVTRRAKYLLIHLDNNKILVMHFGMSGKIFMGKQDSFLHVHASFLLNDNTEIHYYDPRRFGLITIINMDEIDSHKLFINLGIEPLTDYFNANYLLKKFKNKNTNIKQALMDNNIAVGVGNIYAAESLFKANISPLRPASSITLLELEKLCEAIKIILQNAINAGGSSIRDYQNIDGDLGYFQNMHQVYNRYGQRCNICDTIIDKVTQGGRTTFYCKTCQV
jgi:formamidopyrimidine-DNA glycosylase